MARDEDKSKEELLRELAALRAELAVLKATNGYTLERVKPLFPESAVDPALDLPAAAEPSPDPSELKDRPLILVVEDDPVMHGLLELLLGQKYRVVSAFEGQEGLEKAVKLSPDLIVIDIMMPGMSGDQLVMELRHRPIFDDVPLIVLTAKADEQLRVSVLSSNVQAYLQKPFENEEMQIWVDNLITRRLQLLKERRNQGERLRSHVENSPLGVIETDAGLRISYWSPQAEAIFGWSAAEVLGKRPEEFHFIYEEDLEAFARLQAQWFKGEETRLISANRNYHKDGSILYCQWYNSVLLDTAGQPLSTLSLVHNITELKKTEQSLQEAKESLELRVAQRTEELRMVNEQLLRALEIRRQTEEELRANQEAMRRLNHTLARRAAELARANKELKEFSYSISHDLRAPLRAISGFAQIIHRRHLHHLNDEGQHYLNNILIASQQMSHLIDDLLSYARLGREPVQIEPVNLRDIIANIEEHYQRQIEKLEAILEAPPEIPLIQGDMTLLSRLFTNLIDNALKYHRPELSPQLKVGYRVERDSLVVHVQDNGLGIAAEHHQQIFNLFQRLHSLEDYPGTGIGLAIVKRSAQLMNGEVWLESTPGEGTVFYVRLLLA